MMYKLANLVREQAVMSALALLFSISCLQARGQDSSPNNSKPEITLRGQISGKQNHTYVEVPFNVPEGVHRVTLTFDYTGRDLKTALDLGLEDPVELRCWSGGNKSTLTVGISDATPSCLPGLIPRGEWHVLIGVPNIRPDVTSHYTARVFFSRAGLVSDEPAVLRQPLRSGPGWYRGDLHMHTGHSDGRCASQTGQMVPCPVFKTVEAAAKRGLDFIAITDHNATSQYDAMRELQPFFDKVLLIPGREITTFQGHLNIFGTTDFLDFRVGSRSVPNLNVLMQQANRLGALASINHPNAPGGEICMGCRWTPAVPVQMDRFTAVEVVNGGAGEPARVGTVFWEEQLNAGQRLTAIGGSDNHNATLPQDATSAVGHPTTVVYAAELSAPAILDGIRSGRVFIDVNGTRDRMLDVSAHTGSSSTVMGGVLTARVGEQIYINANVTGCDGETAELIGGDDSTEPRRQMVHGERASVSWNVNAGSTRGWFFVEIRDSAGQLLLLGNPIYVNWNPPMKQSGR